MQRAAQLPLLGEHAVPLQVAVGAEVREDIEGIARVLQRPAGFVPPVLPAREICIIQSVALLSIHRVGMREACREWLVSLAVQDGSEHALFGIRVMMDQGYLAQL